MIKNWVKGSDKKKGYVESNLLCEINTFFRIIVGSDLLHVLYKKSLDHHTIKFFTQNKISIYKDKMVYTKLNITRIFTVIFYK